MAERIEGEKERERNKRRGREGETGRRRGRTALDVKSMSEWALTPRRGSGRTMLHRAGTCLEKPPNPPIRPPLATVGVVSMDS